MQGSGLLTNWNGAMRSQMSRKRIWVLGLVTVVTALLVAAGRYAQQRSYGRSKHRIPEGQPISNG